MVVFDEEGTTMIRGKPREDSGVPDGTYPVVLSAVVDETVGLACAVADVGLIIASRDDFPEDALQPQTALRVTIEDNCIIDVDCDVTLTPAEHPFGPVPVEKEQRDRSDRSVVQ